MFSAIYFSVVSTLSSGTMPESIASRILSGQWLDAANAVARRADTDRASVKPEPDDIQLYGDIQLMTGRYEDAEETYRRVQKALRDSRDAMRIASCRNAGWQAVFQQQFNVALNCFKRIADESSATVEQRLDSLTGTTLVLHQLGCIEAACGRLDELAKLAAESNDARWSAMVAALNHDMLTQYGLHRSETLADHVYWRSVVLDFLPRQPDDTTAPLDACAAMPVLVGRLNYLGRLRALGDGKTNAIDSTEPHMRWASQTGLVDYRRALCLEVALAAVAASAPHIGEAMLTQCEGAGMQHNQHARWYLDYLYCLAKVRQQQGRVHEFSQLYGRYAFAAMKHVRADGVMMSLISSLVTRNQNRSDDVSARLPGKYRRAYRYMMDNLDQRDLSVREIASHIGVTERAMQAVFKNALGLTPSQLIRRQRMERIHQSLADDSGHVTSVLDVANKWGVQHRSTLINSYRKFYRESPSETLSR